MESPIIYRLRLFMESLFIPSSKSHEGGTIILPILKWENESSEMGVACLGSHSLDIELRLEHKTASKPVLFLPPLLIPAKDPICNLSVTLCKALGLSVLICQMGGGAVVIPDIL